MAINNKIQNLIRTFVKNISNDKEQMSDTVPVYGTVVVSDGTKQVRLDGGSEPTACLFNVEADEGDRVVCSVQNHSWSVDSNVTKPASSPTTEKGRSDVESIIDEKVVSLSGIDVYYQIDQPTAPSAGFKDGDTWYQLDANDGHAAGLYVWKTNQWVSTQFDGRNIIRANSITGNEIASNTVKANNIDVDNLFAQDITATGTITGGMFKGSTIIVESTPSLHSVYINAGSGLTATKAKLTDCEFHTISCDPSVLSNRAFVIKRRPGVVGSPVSGTNITMGLFDYDTDDFCEARINFFDSQDTEQPTSYKETMGLYGVDEIRRSSSASFLQISGSMSVHGDSKTVFNIYRTDGEILKMAYCRFYIDPDVSMLDPYSQTARDGHGYIQLFTSTDHFDFNKEVFVPSLTITNRAIHVVTDNMAISQLHSSGKSISFGVGSGGVNRGIYDNTEGGWMIYRGPYDKIAVIPGGIRTSGNVIPHTDGEYNLGGSSYRWNVVCTNALWLFRATSYHFAFAGTPTANRTITFQNASGTVAFTSSDIRLKENIEDSDVCALDVINKMQIRKFDWKDVDDAGYNKGTHQNIGFIADELEKLDPRFIVDGSGGFNDDDSINPKCIDTFYLAVHLAKGIQELSDEVQKLKKALQEV